jgi:hypothetical protein
MMFDMEWYIFKPTLVKLIIVIDRLLKRTCVCFNYQASMTRDFEATWRNKQRPVNEEVAMYDFVFEVNMFFT